MQETWVWSLGWKDALEEGSGNPLQCSCLESPLDEEPGGLQSMGSQRVGHDWATQYTQHTYAIDEAPLLQSNSSPVSSRICNSDSPAIQEETASIAWASAAAKIYVKNNLETASPHLKANINRVNHKVEATHRQQDDVFQPDEKQMT